VAADPIGEDNPIEYILLNGFPNPERKGCPAHEVIEALGNRKLDRDDAAWHHIWGCSPCYAEFKKIRDARLARIEGAERRRRTRRRFIAAAVGSATVAVGGYFVVSEIGSKPSRGFAVVSIDLTNAGTVRGAEQGGDTPVARLPRKLDEIHLTLPRFSPLGRYAVAVLQSKSQNAAVALGSANVTGTEQQATLIVTLDLSEARPGKYYLGTRLLEEGQDAIPSYYAVLIG
jgi:hypothetical protein